MDVSIIIPHHNNQHLLQRCVNSIPPKDNIEIIIVDDNSNNKIVDFDKLANSNNPNINIILTKEGKGAGYARNVGINHATGKWLIFADADDFFTDEFEEFLDNYINSDKDCIFYKTDISEHQGKHNNINEIMDSYLNNYDKDIVRYQSSMPWCKMIKHDLITTKSIRFDETKVANDVWFSTLVGYYAQSITVDDRIIYHYSNTENSLSNDDNVIFLITRIKVATKTNIFLKQHGLEKYNIHVYEYFQKLKNKNILLYCILAVYDILYTKLIH